MSIIISEDRKNTKRIEKTSIKKEEDLQKYISANSDLIL